MKISKSERYAIYLTLLYLFVVYALKIGIYYNSYLNQVAAGEDKIGIIVGVILTVFLTEVVILVICVFCTDMHDIPTEIAATIIFSSLILSPFGLVLFIKEEIINKERLKKDV